jgi:hypothetical protein
MAFPDDLEWNQPGVEPTQAKKDEGWKPEEKPPAEYFNWFFNRTSQAVKYLKGESDKSADDTKIGNRTITDTVTATTGANTLTKLLSMLGNMVKQITGKSAWYTAPATTLEAANTHITATSSAHTASAISSTATGDVAATNVQAAIAELASEKAPNSHASTAITYGVSSARNYGHAMASSAVPLIAGTAAIGTDNGKFAREGHVHPEQTAIAGQYAYSWSAIIACATWSRICYMPAGNVYGNAMLLRIAGTRANVVFNHTFMITASHSYKGVITQLVSGSFTNYTLRLVTDTNGQSYVEIYDDAQSATSSTTQTLFCYAKMLSQNGITAYTTFTDGTTLPETFVVAAILNTKSASMAISSGNMYVGNTAVATTDMIPSITAPRSAPLYVCRAWANFDGSAITPTISASGNVSSIVKNSTGNYTINFTTAMPHANYAAFGSISASAYTDWYFHPQSYATTSFTCNFTHGNTAGDGIINLAIFC